MLVDFRTKDTKKALPAAILLVAVALFLLSFIQAKKKDPPDEEMYVSLSLADFGNFEGGDGDTEAENPSENVVDDSQETPSENTEASTTESAEEIETQDTSEISQDSSTGSSSTGNEATQEPEQTVKSDLQKRLDAMNSSNGGGGSDGNDGGDGNEGTADGQVNGTGVFGNGSGWNLSGRSIGKNPVITDQITEEGIVVVDIVVDRNGKVTSAKVNQQKTGTASTYLWNLALKGAKTATFNADSGADHKQAGSITFVFELN